MEDIDMEELQSNSSPGEAASGRGQQAEFNEDDDLYYIPERRPSLDLGQSPMDTVTWPQMSRGPAPALSYVSQTSSMSSVEMDDEEGSSTRVQLERTDSYSSCYSFDSDDCEKKIPKFKEKDDVIGESSAQPELVQPTSEERHPSLTMAFTFTTLCNILHEMTDPDKKRFKMMLWRRYPQSFHISPQSMDMLDIVDRLLQCYSIEVAMQITRALLEEMGQKKMVKYLHTLCLRNEVCYDLGETYKRKYGEVCVNLDEPEEKKKLNEVYADNFISSMCDNGPNIEHEVMKIERLDTNQGPGRRFAPHYILNTDRLAEHINIRFVLLTGVAGSGKSMAVRKLIFDWIKDKPDNFLFPVSFRELKQFEGTEVSLLQIIQTLYPETKKLRDEDYRCDEFPVMFVFDGLDEYNGKLEFDCTMLISDHKEVTTLNSIVVNLLRGRLLYHAIFLVTTRSQIKRPIPWDTHYEEIEVRGFPEIDRNEYFKKRFTNPNQAERVISYIKSCKTLHAMCHLPLFCALVGDEWSKIFREQGAQAEPPRGITYMYTKLVLLLMRQYRKFRVPDRSSDEERSFLMALGKLAFSMLEKGEFKINKIDWKDDEISDEEAVVNSGLCTQYLIKPYVLFHEKVVSFIHPTVQEYLAALYVFLSFANEGKNLFEQHLRERLKGMFKGPRITDMYKSAVDKSLLCEDGKMDIFLRFLFGLSHQTSRDLLQRLCNSTEKWPAVITDATTLLRKRIRENQKHKRVENLQRCLEELGVSASEASR